jgi:hypothetical protein
LKLCPSGGQRRRLPGADGVVRIRQILRLKTRLASFA